MAPIARTVMSEELESVDAGRCVGEALLSEFGGKPPRAAVVYATMNHDHAAVLEGIRSALGQDTALIGCSAQGIVCNEYLSEDGFVVAAMGLGGSKLDVATAMEREIQDGTAEKGRQLAQALMRDVGGMPKVVLVLYDPLCGADVETLLASMRQELACPIVGGAAGQPWGPPQGTFQFWDREVLSHSVVALALSGSFSIEIGVSHGTVPTGIASKVTKASGNHVLEIDGRPAVEVWREITGCEEEDMVHQSHFATWALGLEIKGVDGQVERAIRGAFGFDMQTGAVILQAAVAEGTRVMMHHRTIEVVMGGTEKMGEDLETRLRGRRPWAVLGFECGARTYPFLGQANTHAEHERLRAKVAPEAPWFGMMAWGEIGPCAGRPAFHNFTYPLLVMLDE